MCVSVRSCLFCINLDTATKIIASVYMILLVVCVPVGISGYKVVSVILSLLYLVPLVGLGGALPLERMYFYSVLAISSVGLLVTSCVLIYAESWKKAKLMWPWVSTAWCTSVLLGVVCVIGLVTVSFRASSLQEATRESVVISAYFTHALLLFYCSCVVDSRRIQLVEEGYAEAKKRLMYPMYNVNSV